MSDQKTNQIPKRSEVDPRYTWALEDLFPSDEAWEEALAALGNMPEQMAAYRGRLGESGDTLLAYFRLGDEYHLKMGRLANYAFRKADEDTAVGKYQEMRGKIISLSVSVSAASSFDTPEILAISDETLERFYTETPDLQLYRRALDRVRARREHVLSDAEEKLLASAGEMSEAPEQIGSMFRNADLKFPDAIDSEGNAHQLTQGSYIPMLEGSDRVLRKSAFENLYHTFEGFRHTTAAFLDAQMKLLLPRPEVWLCAGSVPLCQRGASQRLHQPDSDRQRESAVYAPLCPSAQEADGAGRAAYVRPVYVAGSRCGNGNHL